MKSKVWALLLAGVFAACLGLAAWLMLPGEAAQRAEIYSDGERIATVDLSVDQELTVEGKNGTNVITVKDGKIAVTEADCPDHYCMQQGYRDSGTPIVCLPNKLVIEFAAGQQIDGAVG